MAAVISFDANSAKKCCPKAKETCRIFRKKEEEEEECKWIPSGEKSQEHEMLDINALRHARSYRNRKGL